MAHLLMFAAMRQAAGNGHAEIPGDTVAEVLSAASKRFGAEFDRVLPFCMILVNDEKASTGDLVPADAEIALLPPVSGGAL